MSEIASSITCTPYEDKHILKIYLRERTSKGNPRIKTTIAKIKQDVEIPIISNHNVKHLGFNIYRYHKEPDFYINLYYH